MIDPLPSTQALALALVQAAAVGNLPAIEAALQRGAAVDAVPASSRKGWTALLCAADGGHLAVTQCLLQHAASTSIACGPQRVLPLQRAALMAEAEVVGALLQVRAKGAPAGSVFAGARHQSTAGIHRAHVVPLSLPQAGADPNALDAEGWTPLMKAAYSHGDADTIRVLLAGGADCRRAPGRG